MLIEIGSPAVIPLGLVKYENETGSKICLLGLTVQYPPVQIFAQHYSQLQITGPRAHVGYEQALRFLQYHNLKQQAEVEIEYTIPNLVGLGSEALLGLSMAKALSWVHNLPVEKRTAVALVQALNLDKHQAFEIWAFDQGGLLLIDLEATDKNGLPPVIRRQEIEHSEKEAWAFVLYFPDDTTNVSETLEAERWAALWQAAPKLSGDSGQLVDESLWPAVEADDFETFAKSILQLHQMNEAALAETGTLRTIKTEDQAVLEVMQQGGAAAWGQNLIGYSFYGLIKGGRASRELRKIVREQVGFFGGTILATIADNRGATEKEEDRNFNDGKLGNYRVKTNH